jgi:glycosyltransferase involved in cell wall biosynthesis
MAWMRGSGVPEDKLVLVRNAPGHAIAPARRAQILAARQFDRRTRLRVLYLGRLDRQKGLDRLASVIELTSDAGLPVNWRLVGAPVTEAAPLPRVVRALIEPPVYTADALTALLAWADVMVLLSDFEGVPLSVLEAQRLGVVVIATDVGAVSEIIESGRNGLLVRPDTAIPETVELVRLLAENDALRLEIARAASDVADWPETTTGLLARLGLRPPMAGAAPGAEDRPTATVG